MNETGTSVRRSYFSRGTKAAGFEPATLGKVGTFRAAVAAAVARREAAGKLPKAARSISICRTQGARP